MLFFGFFKNCELIRDSSLWHSNFIPLIRDSIIIIGSRSVYTFGSRFTYKRWVRFLSKIWILAFLGIYSNIVCWVSMRVNWGSHQRHKLIWDRVRQRKRWTKYYTWRKTLERTCEGLVMFIEIKMGVIRSFSLFELSCESHMTLNSI